MSYLLLRIEDGLVSLEEIGGDWMTEQQREWFISCGEFQEVCEAIPEVQDRMTTPDIFLVRLLNPGVVVEEAGWDLDYGYDVGGIWLDYENYQMEEMPTDELAHQETT